MLASNVLDSFIWHDNVLMYGKDRVGYISEEISKGLKIERNIQTVKEGLFKINNVLIAQMNLDSVSAIFNFVHQGSPSYLMIPSVNYNGISTFELTSPSHPDEETWYKLFENGDTIDLSSEAVINGVKTQFVWVNAKYGIEEETDAIKEVEGRPGVFVLEGRVAKACDKVHIDTPFYGGFYGRLGISVFGV